MVNRSPLEPHTDYHTSTQRSLEALMGVFTRAALGDFSQDVPVPTKVDELGDLYAGVQLMLETMREKIAEADALQGELSHRVATQTEELERSQSHLLSMINYAPNFIHILDTDLRVTFINRGGTTHKTENIVGTIVGEYMEPADRRRVRRHLRQVIKTGEPTEYEFVGLGENDSQAWYRTTAGPIDRDGTVTGLILITSDITEIRYRTQALQESKQAAESARVRDRALLHSIGEGLIVINEQGKIENVNPSAAAMLGYSIKEMTGQWFPRVVQAVDTSGQEIDPLNRPAMRALSSGQVVSANVHYRRKDGSSFPAAVTISPVIIKNRPVGAVEVFRDVTRERELEQAKEEFVSLASHQLRTPATGVKAYISMLIDGYAGDLTPRQNKFLKKVFDTNERQLQIINDMLNVARVDGGRIVPEMAQTDLKALLQDIVDEQRPTIKERRQDLEVTVPALPVEATVDPQLMRMALENIVNNASKYTSEGGTIWVQLHPAKTAVVVEVRDSGVGVAPEDLSKLFHRFSRIDNPLSTKHGGTGLGLYLAQTIVRLHHGRITVDSRLGSGTTFRVELPLRPMEKPR